MTIFLRVAALAFFCAIAASLLSACGGGDPDCEDGRIVMPPPSPYPVCDPTGRSCVY